MKFWKQYKYFILLFLIAYVLFFGLYYATQIGVADFTVRLQLRRFLPCALAVTAAIFLWKQNGLALRGLSAPALVGIFWLFTHNLTDFFTYRHQMSFMDNNHDICMGAYTFAALACLRILSVKICGLDFKQRSKRADALGQKIFFAVLDFVLLLPPLTEVAYYFSYGHSISDAAVLAVMQTDANEAREFLLLNYGWGGLLCAALAVLLFIFALTQLNGVSAAAGVQNNSQVLHVSRRSAARALLIVLAVICYSPFLIPKTGVANHVLETKYYFDATRQFRSNHERNFANMTAEPAPLPQGKPRTIFLVIGESASRSFMGAYGYPRDTTPWMTRASAEDGGLLFKHAYTSWGQTVPALERALTQKNQYNDREFYDSLTILDLAKKAGYKTYWFSNQGAIGSADTAITLVGKTADRSVWVADTLAEKDTIQYDESLLTLLEEVSPDENNFVVLHVMGSHENCFNRFPPEFAFFSEPGKFDMVTNYFDSLRYTDYVLQKAWEYGRARLNLQALIYFSDHGADPYRKRSAEDAPFIGLRVPLFMWFGKEWRDAYHSTFQTLAEHRESYFTNDLIYDTLGGILNLKTDAIDDGANLASPNYRFTRETLRTHMGRTPLTADVNENEIRQ